MLLLYLKNTFLKTSNSSTDSILGIIVMTIMIGVAVLGIKLKDRENEKNFISHIMTSTLDATIIQDTKKFDKIN